MRTRIARKLCPWLSYAGSAQPQCTRTAAPDEPRLGQGLKDTGGGHVRTGSAVFDGIYAHEIKRGKGD